MLGRLKLFTDHLLTCEHLCSFAGNVGDEVLSRRGTAGVGGEAIAEIIGVCQCGVAIADNLD
jgi:hypothetical protein